MTITIKPDLEKLIRQKMSTGGYASPEELVAAAVSQLVADDFEPGELEELVAEGMADVEAGRLLSGDEVFREIAETSAARRKEQGV